MRLFQINQFRWLSKLNFFLSLNRDLASIDKNLRCTERFNCVHGCTLYTYSAHETRSENIEKISWRRKREKKKDRRRCRILDTAWHNFVNNVVFPQKKFTIAYCDFQTVSLLCAILACGNAVVLSGYNGHGLSYSDYTDVADEYVGSDGYVGYKVLPTVAVPVHAVSAAPLHVDASLDHGYKHVEQEHDYYVSIFFFFSYTFTDAVFDIYSLSPVIARERVTILVKISRDVSRIFQNSCEKFFKIL